MYNPFPQELARKACLNLIKSLDSVKRLDLASCGDEEIRDLLRAVDCTKVDTSQADIFSTRHILGDSCGQMFGVLVCETPRGEQVYIKAFSGQYNSQWEISGWVSPCFNVADWKAEVAYSDPKIKALTKQIEASLVDGLDPAGQTGKDLHTLRLQRKKLSQESLLRIYEMYSFTCFDKSEIRYSDIMSNTLSIPTGTGECCAPKLLNYAYKHDLKPMSLAEFFYGTPPRSLLKEHKTFYSPCEEKCTLILPKMIGLSVLYRDNDIIVVNKPSGVLSVPGKGPEKADCIASRVRHLVPNCIEQPSVHRLDMDTSGILVLGLTKEAHRNLSIQFQDRKVVKEYYALLRGRLSCDSSLQDKTQKEGTIDFPMRVDIENRPYQIYDPEYGRPSTSNWKLVSEEKKLNPFTHEEEWHTKILFSPKTGRTHQLRLHSAHPKGLGLPIVGDRLYGTNNAGERLFLQAFHLRFTHPITNETMDFTVPEEF